MLKDFTVEQFNSDHDESVPWPSQIVDPFNPPAKI